MAHHSDIGRLTAGQHLKGVTALGLPLIGSHLAQFGINLTDTVMMGWYGAEDLAAIVLAQSFYFTLFLFGTGFAWAVMPLVASANGTGDDRQVRRVTRMGLWTSMLFAAACVPLMIWSGSFLQLLGQEPSLAENAQTYLFIAGFGLGPALIVMTLKSYLAAMERTAVVLWSTLAMAGMNALLNYALIFGNWGAPELGIRGAAITSLAVQIVAAAGIAIYAARTLPEHSLFARFWRPDGEVFAQVFRLGWPIGLTSLAEVGLFSASVVMMGWIGTLELAAHGIVLNITSVTFMVHVGLSNAATIRAGQAFGRRDEVHLRTGALVVMGLSACMAVMTIAAFLIWPAPLISLFIDPTDPALPGIILVGTVMLAFAALFQFADSAQVIALGLLRGVQDTRVPMIIAACSYWVIGLPLSYWLAFSRGMGAPGLWLGLVIGLALAGIFLMLRFWLRSVRIAAAAQDSDLRKFMTSPRTD